MFFFFNDTATTEIYTLSLHDALPIFQLASIFGKICWEGGLRALGGGDIVDQLEALEQKDLLRPVPRSQFRGDREFTFKQDRKSTRLNSSHANISYAVFCLKKKKL